MKRAVSITLCGSNNSWLYFFCAKLLAVAYLRLLTILPWCSWLDDTLNSSSWLGCYKLGSDVVSVNTRSVVDEYYWKEKKHHEVLYTL